MALYRFLFAPVLLAVAVIAGPRDRHRPPRPAPVSIEAPAAVVEPTVQHLPAGVERRSPGRAPVR
ncbi:MAG TPA: hypothetical protein VIW03_18155 [Anaeromyxobacter sp.]